jgi:hypothetical protein
MLLMMLQGMLRGGFWGRVFRGKISSWGMLGGLCSGSYSLWFVESSLEKMRKIRRRVMVVVVGLPGLVEILVEMSVDCC